MSHVSPYRSANNTPFATLDKARQSKSLRGLRQCLGIAKRRVDEANTIGWPALAQSWQRDVDAITAMLADAEWERRAA